MPRFRQYHQVGSVESTDAIVMDRLGVGTVYIEGSSFLGSGLFPPLPAPPANPTTGTAYFDTTLGYPQIYGSDGLWHGIRLT